MPLHTGRTYAVTGTDSGIGAATADRLEADGRTSSGAASARPPTSAPTSPPSPVERRP